MFPIADDVPRRGTPWWTWGLILINLLVFALELGLPEKELERLFYLCGIVPARYAHPEWAMRVGFPIDDYWPFFTSMFLHGGWLHVIANMWTLWIFGDNVEDRMGSLRYVLFFLLCGVVSGIVHFLSNPSSTVPAIGASGAIAGVLGAYFVLFPRAHVITVIPIFIFPFFFELPAVFYLGLWFLMQFMSGTMAVADPGASGGIAWWAHIGGFLAGILSFWLFLKPGRWRERQSRYERSRSPWMRS